MVVIEYPWPSKELFQNFRCHWARRAKATRDARFAAKMLTRQCIHQTPSLVLHVEFNPPSNRGRIPDCSNVIGACKAMVDGIADALEVDDSTLIISWPSTMSGKNGKGCVIVRFVDKEIDNDQS